MNRRTAIRQSAFIGILGLTDLKSLFAAAIPSRLPELSSYHRFALAELELTIVTDGHILMKPVQPNFAPGIARERVMKTLDDHFASRQEVDLGINILVVKSGAKVILIDSGCGTSFGNDSGWLAANLVQAGIRPAAVTDVVISHAHPDHIGGLTDKEGKPVFQNAKIYLSRIEYDFWMSASPDFSKSKLKDEALKKLVTEIARKNIMAIKPVLQLTEDGEELLGCIRMKLAAGHTPGHCIAEVFSAGEHLYHVADLVHSHVLSFEHPEWGFEGDSDFDLAVKSRNKVLNMLAASGAYVFSYHLPWPGLGHVKKKGEGFEWIQQAFALPDQLPG